MESYQKSNEELNQIERTLEEEIEISELAQKVAIFDEDVQETKRDYKEAKKELIRRINSLRKIETKTKATMVYRDKLLNAAKLIEQLNDLELQIKNSALAVDEVDCYEFDEKRGRKVFRTEYYIKERSGNRRNSEEERLIKFLNQKQEMIQELKIFIECFNELVEEKRELIYYSFFAQESNVKMEVRLGYSDKTMRRLKNETVIQLIDSIIYSENEQSN